MLFDVPRKCASGRNAESLIKLLMNTNLVALDPGVLGGLAVLINGEVTLHKMPETPRDLCDILDAAQSDSLLSATPLKVYLEKVQGFIGEEGGMPGSRAFTFGESFGIIQGIIVHAKIPYEMVRPQQWQKGLGLPPCGRVRGTYTPQMTNEQVKSEKLRVGQINGRLKNDHKNRLKQLAQQFYPYQKVTLANCDSLLILQWAIKTERMAEPIPPAVPQQSLAI